MKFGMHVDFRNPIRWRRPQKEVFNDTLEFAVQLEKLGVDYCWTTEHHFREEGYIPNPLIGAAGIAMRTERLRVGTSILILPLYNAIRLAEDAAIVDTLSGGRLDLGVGLGYVDREYQVLGVELSERRQRMEEGLAVLQALLNGQLATFHGHYYDFESLQLSVSTLQKPLPIWVGARSLAAARRAGRFGTHLLLSPAGNPTHYDAYRQALAEAGFSDIKPQVAMIMRVLPTYGDPRLVRRRIDEHEAYHNAFHAQLDPKWDPVAGMNQEWREWIIGSPDYCVEEILSEIRDVPVTHLHFSWTIPGIPILEHLPWIELFMSDVAPRLSEHFKAQLDRSGQPSTQTPT